jgi:hypothetical protein
MGPAVHADLMPGGGDGRSQPAHCGTSLTGFHVNVVIML